MTPEQIGSILASNAKAIEANSNMIAQSRRETNAVYNLCSELARNTAELAGDRAVMYEILKGLSEDRTDLQENIAQIATNVARIADALENR